MLDISEAQATVGIYGGKQWLFHQQIPSDESSSNMEVVYLLVWRTGKFSRSFNCELTQKSHPFLKPYPLLHASEERVQTARVQRLMLLYLKAALHRLSFSDSHVDPVPVLPWSKRQTENFFLIKKWKCWWKHFQCDYSRNSSPVWEGNP